MQLLWLVGSDFRNLDMISDVFGPLVILLYVSGLDYPVTVYTRRDYFISHYKDPGTCTNHYFMACQRRVLNVA